MRVDVVVPPVPVIDFFSGVVEIEKHMLIETLISDPGIEGLNDLVWFSDLCELEPNVVSVGPIQHRP